MSTLQVLIRYCSDDDYQGALLLTGEMGCGKTYLIDKELSEALRDTHFIVRVSLLGLNTIAALNEAVRKQWLLACMPYLVKIDQRKDQLKKNGGLISAISAVMNSINPIAGSVASTVVSFDPLEYINLEPEVEDLHNGGEKKKVVLVFDDLERNKLDLVELMGCINEFSENKGFKTIVVADEKVILAKVLESSSKNSFAAYKMIKEKTIVRTVLYIPDYQSIVHDIISRGKWPSREYAFFLIENERVLLDVFGTELPDQESSLGRHHNFRSLNCALREFYRVYTFLTENRVRDRERYLYSFVTYILVSRNGIYKDGHTSFTVSEEEIKQLYPDYSSDVVPASIRQWIDYGIWEEDKIAKELCLHRGEN